MDKKSNFIIILLITVSIFMSTIYVQNQDVKANSENTESNLSYKEKLIRFHVLANSDSPSDQELKLKVRDKIIGEMNEKFKSSKSIDETREILHENMDEMKEYAEREIRENGQDYSVEIKLEPHEFPTKTYGEFTLPSGEYEALRVLIGDAKGANWWCVMFPPLCFVDAKNGIADSKTDNDMKKYLTKDEYEEIRSNGDTKIQLKSKIVETIKGWM